MPLSFGSSPKVRVCAAASKLIFPHFSCAACNAVFTATNASSHNFPAWSASSGERRSSCSAAMPTACVALPASLSMRPISAVSSAVRAAASSASRALAARSSAITVEWRWPASTPCLASSLTLSHSAPMLLECSTTALSSSSLSCSKFSGVALDMALMRLRTSMMDNCSMRIWAECAAAFTSCSMASNSAPNHSDIADCRLRTSSRTALKEFAFTTAVMRAMACLTLATASSRNRDRTCRSASLASHSNRVAWAPMASRFSSRASSNCALCKSKSSGVAPCKHLITCRTSAAASSSRLSAGADNSSSRSCRPRRRGSLAPRRPRSRSSRLPLRDEWRLRPPRLSPRLRSRSRSWSRCRERLASSSRERLRCGGGSASPRPLPPVSQGSDRPTTALPPRASLSRVAP
mmetsp:Transcript_123876/g.358268  ORF Transcript_123876/g.358268 Transcript_123876/m.358268 type:complete len:406 (-) Transcript_123876:106-1323(-)